MFEMAADLLVVLMAEAGRAGGPMGLMGPGLSGLNMPDRRRSEAGVPGSLARLSLVRSDSDGLDTFRGWAVASVMRGLDPGDGVN